jgi:hypothetical protein
MFLLFNKKAPSQPPKCLQHDSLLGSEELISLYRMRNFERSRRAYIPSHSIGLTKWLDRKQLEKRRALYPKPVQNVDSPPMFDRESSAARATKIPCNLKIFRIRKILQEQT